MFFSSIISCLRSSTCSHMLPLVSKLDWMARLAKDLRSDAMHQQYPENCNTIQFETLTAISQPSADLIFPRPFWRWTNSDTSFGALKANKIWQSLPPDCFFVDGNWPILQLYICLMVVVNGITAKLQPCHRRWSTPPLLLRASSRILDLNDRAAAGKGTFFVHYDYIHVVVKTLAKLFATTPVSLNKLTQQMLHGFWFLQRRIHDLDHHVRKKLRSAANIRSTYHHDRWYTSACPCDFCPFAEVRCEATQKESILHSSLPRGVCAWAVCRAQDIMQRTAICSTKTLGKNALHLDMFHNFWLESWNLVCLGTP